MVLIDVRSPDGATLKVETGVQIGAAGAAERLRIPDELRPNNPDPPDKPTTWAEWIQAHPEHPRAQIRDPDSQQRQYIYNPNNMGFRLVSGTCDAGDAPNTCAARELWEETGLDVRAALERLVAVPDVGGVPAFRVDATAVECAAVTALLTQRIAERKGEVFAFTWEAPVVAAPARYVPPHRRRGGRKTKRSKRIRRTRRR